MAEADGLSGGGGEPLAVYERRVAACEERVWENVLDWEHLPWLHASSFRAIHCEDAGADGWRARVVLAGAEPREITIELRIDWDDRSYHTRTVAGPGTGSDIFTRVRPAGPDATDVRVEFRVPGAPPERASALGRGYVALYTRLWDEDEAMMQRREAFLAGRLPLPRRGPRPPLPLGPVDALRARLPRVVESGGVRFRIASCEGRLLAHALVCPHLGGPLEEARLEDGAVVCPWHGYRFDCATGRGPAGQRCRLPVPARVVVEGGEAVLHFG